MKNYSQLFEILGVKGHQINNVKCCLECVKLVRHVNSLMHPLYVLEHVVTKQVLKLQFGHKTMW